MTSSSDLRHRFIFDNSNIRGQIVTLSKSYTESMGAQSIPNELKPLFGQFLAGISLVSGSLKFPALMSLQVRGQGNIHLLMTEANDQGQLRGVVRTQGSTSFVTDDSAKLKPLSELFGPATLSITLDPEKGERYQGIVPLDGLKLSDCLELYFEQSEQLPTFILLFADQEQCGGLLLQSLPNAGRHASNDHDDQWETICQLAASMKAEEFFSADHPTLLYRLFHEQSCRIFEPSKQTFKCSCSRKRSEHALKSLAVHELDEMIQKGDVIEVDCQFCGAIYDFDIETLNVIKQSHSHTH